MKKIIGIDFDGTCVTDLYPYVGDNIGAASVLRELGDKNLLILYTVRDGKVRGIMKKIYICIHKIITYSHPSGMDRWEYKNSQSNCLKQLTGYFFCHTISVIFPCQNTN